MIDLRQTPEYSQYLIKIGWKIEKVEGVYIYIKRLPITGSVIKIQRPEKLVTRDQLLVISKKYKCIYLLIEPKDNEQYQKLLKQGLNKSNNPSLPTKTIHFDLLKSEKKLLSDMHSKTRYNIGLSKRKGVEVRHSKEIRLFSKLWQESAKKRGMYLSQQKEIEKIYQSFGKNAVLLFARKEKKIIGGVMTLFTPQIAYYMYAFSTSVGNKLHAPSLLTWESIGLGKKNKKKLYDFEGIYDNRFPLNSWKGFSKFKLKFGGRIIKHPPPVSKWLPLIDKKFLHI